ncbi:ubiquitin carboxyl-terminal hydrolase 37-like [Mya arenaria]|uniref:ubiquitin carboxyl-terminal hydrolase 37-like n=1 Tax=Mya arenaria TaxID=6604 RepID=UPI0022DF93BE|nr:ubiquitin carboxyl-terminal hydrolase 37-like [Mya arenaria]
MNGTSSAAELFHGQVKVTDQFDGSQKWKSGSISVEKKDSSYFLRVLYDVGNSKTYAVNRTNLIKVSVKPSHAMFDLLSSKGGCSNTVTIMFKPSEAVKGRISHLDRLMNEIRSNKHAEVSKAEVCRRSVLDTSQQKNVLNSPVTQKDNSENAANNFTSVKSVKKEEEKENLMRSENMVGNQFLQRSAEKSREPLSLSKFYGAKSSGQMFKTSTPTRGWLSSVKRPGLMPDPSPNPKRPRLLSDRITYSMKQKQTTDTNTTQQQALQGFSNLGNTCYMNAILQSLFGLDTFSTDLIFNRKLLKTLQPQSLYYSMAKLLHVRRQHNASEITRKDSLRRVKSAISNTARRFSGYGQHDAHEFLCQVLDQLKEEVVKLSKATPTPNKEMGGGEENSLEGGAGHMTSQNPITVNFEFEVLHTLTCLQCGEQVSKAEQFHDISLDVPKQKDIMTARSLQDALSLFFRSEEIDYTCEKCGHGKSDVTHKITRLPRVFILHLKRYTYSHTFAKNTKMGQRVSIPTYLTMEGHCTEKTMPAFPPNLLEQGFNDNKPDLDDSSKEETPSRRKLDYSGYRFKNKSTSTITSDNTSDSFMETKEKMDETDGTNVSRPLAIEEEEDSELKRAIEMSLQEHQHREKVSEDFGDGEENLEKTVEMNRNNQPEEKNLLEMTFEEQLELAMHQSLMETNDHYGDNTDFDDVINHGDHMYTKTDDEMNEFEHFENSKADIFDEAPDEGNFRDNLTNTVFRKRSNTDGCIKNKPNISERKTVDDIFTSKETPPHFSPFPDIETSEDSSYEGGENVKVEERGSQRNPCPSAKFEGSSHNYSCSSAKKEGTSHTYTCSSGKTEGAASNRFQERLNKITKAVYNSAPAFSTDEESEPSSLDLSCTENLDDFEDEISDKVRKQNGKHYELDSVGLIESSRDISSRKHSSEGVKLKLEQKVSNGTNSESPFSSSGLKSSERENMLVCNNSIGKKDLTCQCWISSSDSEKCEKCLKRKKLEESLMSESKGPTKSSERSSEKIKLQNMKNCRKTSTSDDAKMDIQENDIANDMDNVDNDEAVSESVGKESKDEGVPQSGGKEETSTDGQRRTELKEKCVSAKKSGPTLADKEKAISEEEKSFMDEDDSWLSLVDDKENKKPEKDSPRLSDPAEFEENMADRRMDEVDGVNDTSFNFPEVNNEKGDLPYSYRLVSVVNHMGISSTTGHYISDVYDMKKRSWHSYDDSHVTNILESNVKSQRERSGYIFFYMSKDIVDDLNLQYSLSSTSKK